MIKRLILRILLIFLIFSYSCLEDKGNYDYISISDIVIDGISKQKYEVFAFIDTLKIVPNIQGLNAPDNSRYNYEWKIMPRTGDDTKDSINHVISTDKILDYPVTLENGEYIGYFKVSDLKEDTHWGESFRVTVKSLTNEGFMVLSEDNGQGRLDMISNLSENEYITAYNIWQKEDYNFGKPINLFFNYNRNTPSSTMYVSESGTYLLDKELKTSEARNLRWALGSTPEKIIINGTKSTTFSSKAPREVLITEKGELYARSTSLLGSVFEFPVNYINGKTEFEPSPIIGMPIPDNAGGYWPYGHTIMLYDNTNKQFLEFLDKNEYPTVINFTNNNALFPSKTNREILYAQSTLNRETFAILKDEAENKTYIYGMQLTYDGVNTQKIYTELLGSELDNIRHFAFHPLLPYLFYSTDNKVYQFDYSQPKVPAKEMLNFEALEVATINFFPMVGWNPYETWERNKALLLVIGINNPIAGLEDPGMVQFYTAPALNGPLVLKKSIEGFGRIMKIVLRER